MNLITRKTATALITSLLLIPMSCEEGDLDASAENTEDDGVEIEDATENADESQSQDESITLAEINLSDTHKITLAIESDDEYSLTEILNVDLDGDHPSYATLNSEGMSLSEVYDHLAGEQWNAKTRRVFESADDAIFEASLKRPVEDFNPDRIEELMDR